MDKITPNLLKIFYYTLVFLFVHTGYSQHTETMIKLTDFDFLPGHWTVENKKLKERLKNSNEWIEFPATLETREILNGLGSTDEFRATFPEGEFVGLSVRIVNPANDEWTIYWADTAHPELKLTEQVSGFFEDGIGLFYGEEVHDGKKVRLRFLWKKETANTAQWEQAYWDEARDEWETNWIMVFTKIE